MNFRIARRVNAFFVLLACCSLLTGNANAYEALDNDLIRFGTGSEASVNAKGTLQQPFYYDASLVDWYKLTFSNYPLDIALGVDGDGSNDWNTNGTIFDTNPADNYVLAGQVLDVSGFTVTSGSKGYGTIVSTGTVTIAGKDLQIENTYTLQAGKPFVTINTRVTNNSGGPLTNLRVWVGTRDDYVGIEDRPTKERGNLVSGAFELISNATDQATALRIKTATTGVLFYSTSPKAYTSIQSCCSFSNAYNQDPASAAIMATGDGSYALYVRMADLADGESEDFTWYYAAGQLTDLDDIVSDVASSIALNKTLEIDGVLTFAATDFIDTNDVILEKIRITGLPANGVLKLSGIEVVTNQEILQADYANLTYTPDASFNGTDSFDWEAWDSVNMRYLAATTANLNVVSVDDTSGGTEKNSGEINTNLSGIGSLDIYLLSIFGGLVLLRRNSKRLYATGIAIALSCLWVPAMAAMQVDGIESGESGATQGAIEAAVQDQASRYYYGLGLGISRLDPDLSDTDLELADDQDEAISLLMGFRYDQDWSLEATLTDLGRAELERSGNSAGRVKYRVLNISATYRALEFEVYDSPFSVNLSGGVAKVDSSANVPYDRNHSASLSIGAFIQYSLASAVKIRLGYESFGEDTALIGASLIFDIESQAGKLTQSLHN